MARRVRYVFERPQLNHLDVENTCPMTLESLASTNWDDLIQRHTEGLLRVYMWALSRYLVVFATVKSMTFFLLPGIVPLAKTSVRIPADILISFGFIVCISNVEMFPTWTFWNKLFVLAEIFFPGKYSLIFSSFVIFC